MNFDWREKFEDLKDAWSENWLKVYWKIGPIVAVLIFIVTLIGSLIFSSIGDRQLEKEYEKELENCICVKYYMSDNYDYCEVASQYIYHYETVLGQRIKSGNPAKSGYKFIGLYDAPSGGNKYVDSTYLWIISPDEDILLYPQFEKEGE